MRCSFEETVDILLEAAAFAERDHMRGVSENIMLGQYSSIGTGAVTLLLNEEMLQDAIEVALPWADGADFPGMTPGRSPGAMTPAQSPGFALSPAMSPFDTTAAAFSPFNEGVFSPTSPGCGRAQECGARGRTSPLPPAPPHPLTPFRAQVLVRLLPLPPPRGTRLTPA